MAFPRRLLVDSEQLVLDLRPHWIALVRGVVVALLVVAAWIVLLVIVGMPDNTFGSIMTWVILGVGAGLILWITLRDLVGWLTSSFVVTSDRVIHREGFIAKRSMEIPLEAINDIRFEQGVFERIIGAGTLVIRSASEAGRNEFKDVRHPEEVQKTIYHQGELNQQRMRGTVQALPGVPSTSSELTRLADLRDRGVLTEGEFQAQKARILGTGPAPPPPPAGS